MADPVTADEYYRVLKGRRDGTIPDNPLGYYVVRPYTYGGEEKPCLKQVTPVAQALEIAQSEIEESKRKANPTRSPSRQTATARALRTAKPSVAKKITKRKRKLVKKVTKGKRKIQKHGRGIRKSI